eukprot:3813545-Amphidinium_carterae.3
MRNARHRDRPIAGHCRVFQLSWYLSSSSAACSKRSITAAKAVGCSTSVVHCARLKSGAESKCATFSPQKAAASHMHADSQQYTLVASSAGPRAATSLNNSILLVIASTSSSRCSMTYTLEDYAISAQKNPDTSAVVKCEGSMRPLT